MVRLIPWTLTIDIVTMVNMVLGKKVTWFQVASNHGKYPIQDRPYLLTYLQFSVIKWAKQRPGQNPIDIKSDEAIQI